MLPKAYARTGYAGDYFLVAQWFPKVAVYEPAGTRGRDAGGWNAHQFHADSEFYADFGHYRVAITLPTRFVVGATGVRTARADHADGTHHSHLRTGRRARLRVDGVAALRRDHAPLRRGDGRERRGVCVGPRRGSGDRSTSCGSATSRCGC